MDYSLKINRLIEYSLTKLYF